MWWRQSAQVNTRAFLSTVLPPGANQHFPPRRSHLLQVHSSWIFSKMFQHRHLMFWMFMGFFSALKRKITTKQTKLFLNKAKKLKSNNFLLNLTFLPDNQSSSNKSSSKSLKKKARQTDKDFTNNGFVVIIVSIKDYLYLIFCLYLLVVSFYKAARLQ